MAEGSDTVSSKASTTSHTATSSNGTALTNNGQEVSNPHDGDHKISSGHALPSPPGAKTTKPAKELYPLSHRSYDLFLWTMSVIITVFFREVHPRGSWRIPRTGPVFFVAAPHSNQFVDALILQKLLWQEAKRRVSILVAEKSVYGFIGWASRQTGAVPVGRAQDSAKPKPGSIYLPSPLHDPTLIRGIGTDFERDAEVGGIIFLPAGRGQGATSVDILKIISPTEVRIKRSIKEQLPLQQLTGRDDVDRDGNFADQNMDDIKEGYQGTKFKVAPHIDQSRVYEAVFQRFGSGECCGIYPEGGSHDRTSLLPLKAGVAVMALGAAAEYPGLGLTIVPVGMNYFAPHKFRSRAVVEFGQPIEVPPELVEQYASGNRREPISTMVDTIYQALTAVTVQTPDYDTLMLIQAARRLYKPTGKKIPLSYTVELNRRLAMGYQKYKDDPRVSSLTAAVKDYNSQLRYLNLRDHQVQYAKLSIIKVFGLFIYRILKLLILLVGTLPGTILFAPVFVTSKIISIRKAKSALAASTVKIQGRDVVATWKILTALGFAPILYNLYISIFVWRVYQDRLWGYWDNVPEAFPLWASYPIGWILFPVITLAALRLGEVGMDIFKSLRPLVMCMNPSSSYNIQQLRLRRAELSERVTDAINELGPEMFPDFDKIRIVSDPLQSKYDSTTGASSPTSSSTSPRPKTPSSGSRQHNHHHHHNSHARNESDVSTTSTTEFGSPPSSLTKRDTTTASSRGIARNDSFSNIGKVGLFSTRPPSRDSRSRSSSAGGANGGGGGGFGSFGAAAAAASFPVASMTSLDGKASLEEVSRKIRQEMRQRGELRRRKTDSTASRATLDMNGGHEEDQDSHEDSE